MKPGSFALHCKSVTNKTHPQKKEIKQWKDSDKKWANLKRCDGDIFQDKTTIWIVVHDGCSAYVVLPRFYLGKTLSTLKLKAMCITDGCTKVCAFNVLYKHFKEAHMPGTHTIHLLQVIEAPDRNDVEESNNNEYDESKEGNGSVKQGIKGTKGKTGDVVGTSEMLENSEAKGPDNNTFANKQNKTDEAAVEHNGTDGDSMELDCEPYVNEGGPSDDDTEAEDAKIQASVAVRKKKAAVPSHGVRKSTRTRRPAAHY